MSELREAARTFLNRVKELQPHIDGQTVFMNAHGFEWTAGDWVKERDALEAALSRPAPTREEIIKALADADVRWTHDNMDERVDIYEFQADAIRDLYAGKEGK